jgi:signal transduction histidine kinase
LIEELLDVSRIVAGKLALHTEVVDLADVVHIAIDTVRPSADAKTIGLEVDAEAGCLVKGDAVRLQQVVGNLLHNAVKFSRMGGRIQVSLKPVNAQAAIVVQDEGVGIAPELLPFVFDRFRQADGVATRSHGGLGLGLTVVRHLVTAHDGSITAHSKGTGQGATFAIALPLQPSMTVTLEQLPTTVG